MTIGIRLIEQEREKQLNGHQDKKRLSNIG